MTPKGNNAKDDETGLQPLQPRVLRMTLSEGRSAWSHRKIFINTDLRAGQMSFVARQPDNQFALRRQ